MPKIRVAAYTGGRTISSSRFRVRQYISPLKSLDIQMREFVAPLGAWPPTNRMVRPFWAIASLASRFPGIAASYYADLTFLQREMLSTFRTLEPLTKGPRVLDLDDAVWMSRESQLRKLVQTMDGVVCGNDFIAEWVARCNPNHMILPTAVDTARWHPREPDLEKIAKPSRRIIGWTGLYAGSMYLLNIERALARVLYRYPDVTLRVVSDRRPEFRILRADQIEYIPWSAELEVATMQEMTIGIMPLHDTPWERGKCSYKMLLYMSCGLPVVVSPVGMNGQVLSLGESGFAARNEDEWVDALSCLLSHPVRAGGMGQVGREVVIEHFALAPLASRLAEYFQTFVN